MGCLRKDAKIHCIYDFSCGHLRKVTVLGVFMASQAASTAENEQQITKASLEYAFNGGLKDFEQYLNTLPNEQSLRLLDAVEEELISR